MSQRVYTLKDAIEPLKAGETIFVKAFGNSMVPLVRSGETVRIEPVTDATVLAKNDVVVARVRGRVYLHKIIGLEGKSGHAVEIGNNKGHSNGWIPRWHVYGRRVADEGGAAVASGGPVRTGGPTEVVLGGRRAGGLRWLS